MREYFREVLKNFHLYCGNRSQIVNWTDDEIKKLLDLLCKVSQAYAYIPEESQKIIIDKCLLQDTEYQNLNARIVSQWLEKYGKHWFVQSAHEPIEITSEPVKGDDMQKWLDVWQKQLNQIQDNFTGGSKSGGSGSRLKEDMYGGERPEEVKKILKEQASSEYVIEVEGDKPFSLYAKSEQHAKDEYELAFGKISKPYNIKKI